MKKGNDIFLKEDRWFNTDKYELIGFEVIDLSDSIEEHSEVPGEKGYSDPDVVFEKRDWVTLDIKPYHITKIVMGAHTGTHIDAPMHAKNGGASIDEIPNEFIGPVIIIEVNEKLDDSSLQKALSKLERNSIIVIRGKPDYRIPESYRNQIIRSNPRLVVFGDCVNVDGVEDTVQYLNNNIPMIMGANQDALDSLENGDIIFALPIKLQGIEAAPVRLFALILKLFEKVSKEDSGSKKDFDFTV